MLVPRQILTTDVGIARTLKKGIARKKGENGEGTYLRCIHVLPSYLLEPGDDIFESHRSVTCLDGPTIGWYSPDPDEWPPECLPEVKEKETQLCNSSIICQS